MPACIIAHSVHSNFTNCKKFWILAKFYVLELFQAFSLLKSPINTLLQWQEGKNFCRSPNYELSCSTHVAPNRRKAVHFSAAFLPLSLPAYLVCSHSGLAPRHSSACLAVPSLQLKTYTRCFPATSCSAVSILIHSSLDILHNFCSCWRNSIHVPGLLCEQLLTCLIYVHYIWSAIIQQYGESFQ